MLNGSGPDTLELFENLFNLFFIKADPQDYKEYVQSPELQALIDAGWESYNLSSILSGSRKKICQAFKELCKELLTAKHGEYFPSDKVKALTDAGWELSIFSSMLNKSGANAAEAFAKLFAVLFKKEGIIYVKSNELQ